MVEHPRNSGAHNSGAHNSDEGESPFSGQPSADPHAKAAQPGPLPPQSLQSGWPSSKLNWRHPIRPIAASTTLRNQVRSALLRSQLAPAVPYLSPQVWLRSIHKSWRWTIVWLAALFAFGGMGLSALLWLSSLPPLPRCQSVTPKSSEAQRLYCAQQAARSGELSDLLTGIKLIQDWPSDHPLYAEVQKSLADWSGVVLIIARSQLDQSDLKGAIAAAQQIPKTSPAYGDAQKAIATWQQIWQKGQAIYAKGQEAIQNQDWKTASDQVVALGQMDQDYWRVQQADALSQQIVVEKQGRDSLTKAQKLAKQGGAAGLGAAVEQVQQVDPKTMAGAEAKAALQEWGQTLVEMGLQQWQDGDVASALATVKPVPLALNLSPEGQELVRFSHANQLATGESEPDQPLGLHTWNFWQAINILEQIQPNSPLYEQAQARLQDWRADLQDLIQLQFAALTAGLGQQPALESAIAQATQITPDRPQHDQAQSLIASWTQILQQIEDRPYLNRAQAMAQPGKIADLQRAILQADQIPADRPARTEADKLIAQWNRQLQALEDQPLLDQAALLAKQEKWQDAAEMVQKITPDRPLYAQGQALLASWKDKLEKIQAAQDRPILEQAKALADREHYSEAMSVAAQITPDRVLYSEAQSLISGWKSRRDEIWKQWDSEGTLGASEGAGSPSEGGQ